MKAKGRDALASFVFTDKYAHSVDNYTRRETKQEVVDRLIDMHKNKFKDHTNHVMILEKLEECRTAIMNNEIMPSMRSLQNSPYAIEKNNTRMYNCAASPLDRVEFFKQLTFVLLSGCGVGFSVIPENISQLPTIDKTPGIIPVKLFMVPDSIEGWSDSMDFLVKGLFEGYDVDFNYSFVRPEGSIIRGSVGLAPGPDPLKKAHDNLKQLFSRIRETGQERITSVDATDICCFIADCVRSGGIRRSALICLFDPQDTNMIEFKAPKNFSFETGKNLHRQQVNISSILDRSITKPELKGLIEFARDYFEPGIFLSNNKHKLTNPCLRGDTLVETKKGAIEIKDLVGEEVEVMSNGEWVKVSNFRVTGKNQPIMEIKLRTSDLNKNTKIYHSELCTPYHTFILEDGTRLEAKDLETWDTLKRTREDGKVTQILSTVNRPKLEPEVYCCTIPKTHSFGLACGVEIGQCGEIGLWPYVDKERTRSCFHFCNLTTTNMKNVDSPNEMNRRTDLATFLGVIQSSYTTFDYLGKDTEFVTARENLLGVSMTGIRDNEDMNKVREAISQGSRFVKDRAKVYTNLIGVNMPARITTCKPEGSCSKVMSTASGVHRDFYKNYIQRIVAKKDSAIVEHVLATIPEAWEANPYDPTGNSGYLLFPIETAHGGKDTVEEQLDLIKFLQKEWINPASSQELCVVPMQHSVSNTVSFRDEDFDTMVDIIHEDREWHSGVSFQAESNPFAYPNSPITPVNLDEGTDDVLLAETPYTVDKDRRQQWANTRFVQLKEAFDSREIDWDNVPSNSPVDMNFGIACSGGACDLD